jgi:isochorismate hydrolase
MLLKARGIAVPDMLVIVDLQRELVDMLTYRHGPVSLGIRRVEGLISFCKRLGMPLALVTSVNWPEIEPSVLAAAGPSAPIFTKKRASAFSDEGFVRFVEGISPENMILGGSIRHLCVKSTALGALERGYGVLSSDEMLFGSADVDSPEAIAEALRSFSRDSRFFPDIESLKRSIRANPTGGIPA